jgi:hypothetical protein
MDPIHRALFGVHVRVISHAHQIMVVDMMMGEFESLHRLAGSRGGWKLGPEIVHVRCLAVA